MNDSGDPLSSSGDAGRLTSTAMAATEQTRALRSEIEAAESAGKRFSGTLLGAFEGIAFKGKSLGDTFKSLALSMSQMALKAAFAPLEKGIGSLVTGLFKGGMGFAHGGAFQQGRVMPFASGGVISSPMTFPMAGGMTGLAGERGAEAILPLARGRDGRLGVVAGGGSGGASITINISTPDAESFRKSETQVAAMIARAAAMGQRNL
ncbi:MAG: phage tail tape measure protein [Hyphomicrobium sp.]